MKGMNILGMIGVVCLVWWVAGEYYGSGSPFSAASFGLIFAIVAGGYLSVVNFNRYMASVRLERLRLNKETGEPVGEPEKLVDWYVAGQLYQRLKMDAEGEYEEE